MRCDHCLIYRPNVIQNDRRADICRVFGKIFSGFDPDHAAVICDGCRAAGEDAVLFSPDCAARRCVIEKGLEHCGCCDSYPCLIYPAEPTREELVQKIDVEGLWTWEDES